MRYLTKSRFRLALDCITKLYYKNHEDYADQKIEDPFLEALAEGGFQVGELAKFHFCNDPIAEKITIETLDNEEALKETNQRLKAEGKVIIAEAAFCHETLFIRTDVIVKNGNNIDLYEVKSKSVDGGELEFLMKKGSPRIATDWRLYLYDVAFQKYVMAKSLEGSRITISAHLIMVDKSKVATVEGLNQMFKISKTSGGKPKVQVTPGLNAGMLGETILRVINVDDVISRIWKEFPVPTDIRSDMSFEEFIHLCARVYSEKQRIFAPLGKKCKECEFIIDASSGSKKSGFHECWTAKTGFSDELLRENLVLDLWGGMSGSRSIVQELIDKGKYLLRDVTEDEVSPKATPKGQIGLNPHQRRMEQINRMKAGNSASYFDEAGLKKEMAGWNYPLHMIDFETTMTALPFHAGRHPYEGIAFQFSHHTIQADGVVEHAGEYLSFEPGVFPNYELVRQLRVQLEADNGTIFRYHNHENTYLNIVFGRLEEDPHPPADKRELQAFIRSITSWKDIQGSGEGSRCMVDLYQLVLRYYYPPLARGSNSLKQILPAIIQDSKFLRGKYSKPVYGRLKEIRSLNFDEHVWIEKQFEYDPYKTLPRLFEQYSDRELDRLLLGFNELIEGGAAMTAYNYLQFSEIPAEQREELRNGLLRYCELDTMAMVMVIEGWNNFG